MKTLVIHPSDPSTDFLKPIYEAIPEENKTVVTTGKTFDELKQLIQEHDRVMMLGHGWTFGLFNVSGFKTGGLVIDERMVETLNEKEGNIFIWCRAHVFVDYYKLKGFNTDMFVSEVGEAFMVESEELPTQQVVDESNETFVNIIKKYINEDFKTMHSKTYEEYGVLAESNPVADYNHQRLFLNE